MTIDNLCEFANKVSYTSEKLYECSYKKRCDDQLSFGYTTNFCKKYLKEDIVPLNIGTVTETPKGL